MSVEDVGLIGAVVFVTAIIVVIVAIVGTNIAASMLTNPIFTADNRSSSTINAMVNNMYKYDWIVFAVFLGLLISMMLVSWFVGGNPIFMFIYFIVECIFVISSFFIANAWESFATAGPIQPMIAHFPLSNFILLQMPYFTCIAGIASLVVMFGKPSFSGKGGL